MMRERLPDRREAETFEITHRTHDGVEQTFIVSIGHYPDGRLGEIFIEVPYQQQRFVTALMAKDVATMLSIALQHGATVEELLAATGRSEVNEMGRAVERPHTLIGTVLAGLMEKAKCEAIAWSGTIPPQFVRAITAYEAANGGEASGSVQPRSFWMHYDLQVGHWVVDDRPPSVVRTGSEVIHVLEVLPASHASGERDAWAGSSPFITSESGGGEYAVRIKVHSMDELHAAHTIVLKAFGANL